MSTSHSTWFDTAYYPNTFIIGQVGRIKQHHVGFRGGDGGNLEREVLSELEK